MANYLYTGKVRDGKTHHVMGHELLPALKRGRNVYTNIEGLKVREIASYLGKSPVEILSALTIWHNADDIREAVQLLPDEKELPPKKIKPHSLVVIDEAQMVWGCRDFKDTKKGFLTLLEYCGHHDIDLVFVTQNAEALEKSVRRMTNEFYHVKNMKFLSAVLGSRYCVQVRQSVNDISPMRIDYYKFDNSVFRCYSSFQYQPEKRKLSTFLGRPSVILPVVAFVAFFATHHHLNFFKKTDIPVDTPKIGSAVVSPTVQPLAISRSENPVSVDSPRVCRDYIQSAECRSHDCVWYRGSLEMLDGRQEAIAGCKDKYIPVVNTSISPAVVRPAPGL